MSLNINSAYILLLLCLPLQFNLFTDSWDLIIDDMVKGWKDKKEISYYQKYFGKKATLYAGTISSFLLIFIFYKINKTKLIISITFLCNAITWLIYFLMNEKKIYIAYILRSLQGIYLACFHVLSLPYMMNFIIFSKKCFCGCLIQFSMFLGLFFINLLFVYLSWKDVVIILFVISLIFSGLIWLVPELHIKPKKITKEYIYQKDNLFLLIIMLFVMILQHLSGIGILLGQLSRVLKGIGLDLDSHLQACLFDFVGSLSVINSAFMSDIINTKYMWCLSSFGLCVGLAIYGATIEFNLDIWISSLAIFFFFLFYGLGVGPIPWYLNGTLFNENVRIEASGINLCLNLFLSPVMDYVWIKLDDKFGQLGSVIFAFIFDFISIIFGFYVIPEEQEENEDNINII